MVINMKQFFEHNSDEATTLIDASKNKWNHAQVKVVLETAFDLADHYFDLRFKEGGSTSGNQENLKNLLGDIEKIYQKFEETHLKNYKDRTSEDKQLDILYHLATGNILMRIQQLYLDNYCYKLAEQWYDKVTDILWLGKNKSDDYLAEKCSEDVSLYRLLFLLNIGKSYRNFALQHRRSDFRAAEAKFKAVKKEVENSGDNLNRKRALLWMDASIEIARIYRYRYGMNTAKREFQPIYEGIERAYNKTNSVEYQTIPIVNKIINFLREDDKKTYYLQLLIEQGILYRKDRDHENAISNFIKADNLDNGSNVDAINNLSSTLRKLITSPNTKRMTPEKISAQVNFVQKKVRSRNGSHGKSLLEQICIYAQKGNIYAMREYIRWHIGYCSHHKNTNFEAVIFSQDSSQPFHNIQDILNHLVNGLNSIIKEASKPIKNASDELKHIVECANNQNSDNSPYNIKDIWIRINCLIEIANQTSSIRSEEKSTEDLQLLFLRGQMEFEFQCYNNAINTFELICEREESHYIRRGTIGLKARYMLAQSYMALTQFRKAKMLLSEIRDELKLSHNRRTVDNQLPEEQKLDSAPDFRVERDYGYCLMRLGNYEEACAIYTRIYNCEESHQYSDTQQAMCQNNYVSCLIHLGDIDKAKEILEDKNLQLFQREDDCETNLMRGYLAVCHKKYELAQPYFEKAYFLSHTIKDYTQILPNFNDSKLNCIPSNAIIRDVIERRSAYIINLTKLSNIQKDCVQTDKFKEKIEAFLQDISPSCILSMKAMIALGQWLVTQKDEESEEANQLYRSFSLISLYPERGSLAFNEFKKNNEFCYFQSAERGKMLAYLFAMYKSIKVIKENLCFSKKDLNYAGNILVHYTDLKTLKILLSENAKENNCLPHFRVNNCGYMNDVFEGTVFLDMMRALVVSPSNINREQKTSWHNMMEKYFPHMIRSEENMIPVGRNVYIASLSIKEDSFPLWSIYAKNEAGCNISFGENFFDIVEPICCREEMRDYLISTFTDEDYPLYSIKYLNMSNFSENQAENMKALENEKIPLESFQELLKEIFNSWEKLDTKINALEKKYFPSTPANGVDSTRMPISAIRTFTADRINEIRFLFKDEDYRYEGEVRVVVTTSKYEIDEEMSPPRVYTEVNRPIQDVSVRLGSKIDDITADQYVTWLKQTGKVREVKLSKRNRRTRNK